MGDAYIVDAVRTARGRKKNGSLNGVHPVDVAAHALRSLVERVGLDPGEIDDVAMGCVSQVGEQAFNIARGAVLAAGFPIGVPGHNVQRVCGSGQQAVNAAAMAVMAGVEGVMIGGGVESMSRIPIGSDWPPPPGAPAGVGGPYSPGLTKRFPDLINQGLSAEMIVDQWGLSRADVDEFAMTSQRRAATAIEEGRFKGEIVPMQVPDTDSEAPGATRLFDTDEHVRPDTTLEGLGKLRTVFKEDGTLTAGNSSGIVDGAAAVLVASKERCEELGLRPRARIRSIAVAGSDPVIMLTGPIPASQKALSRAGMSASDIDLVEINEAFASVPLACARDLGFDLDRVNVNGGAIALGHPLGATGAMLIATLLGELERRDASIGLSTMCIGYGMGIATIIERV